MKLEAIWVFGEAKWFETEEEEERREMVQKWRKGVISLSGVVGGKEGGKLLPHLCCLLEACRRGLGKDDSIVLVFTIVICILQSYFEH